MAVAYYLNKITDQRIGRCMPIPKKVSRIDAWLKQARKTIPEIPDPYKDPKWSISTSEATIEEVRFTLVNNSGFEVLVVIRRKESIVM